MFDKKNQTNKKGFNKFMLISIAVIVFMSYFFLKSLPGRNTAYPDTVTLRGVKYQYTQALKASSLCFARLREPSDEGIRLLIYRKDKKQEHPPQVFIYIGGGKYRLYNMLSVQR